MKHQWSDDIREKRCTRSGCPWRMRPKTKRSGARASVAVEFSNGGEWAVLKPWPKCEGAQ